MNISPVPKNSVLVIGAGYLGSSLALELRERDHCVVTADLQGERANYKADVRNPVELQRLKNELQGKGFSPSWIVYSVSTRGGSVDEYRRIYVEGVSNLVRLFPEARLFFCSSTAVYGVADGAWVTEEHSANPVRPQSRVLLDGELIVRKAGGVVGRLSALYGPGRCVLVEKYMLQGEALPGDPDRWVNYVHRDDAVSAMIHLMDAAIPGGCFNITDMTPMRLREVYAFLSRLVDRPMPRFTEAHPSSRRGMTNQRISCSLLMSQGWEPLYLSVVDGVHNVLEDLEMKNDDLFPVRSC